jgi:hypothetical protein
MLKLILATWRLTSLLHREEGPAHLFEKLRYKMGVRYNAASEPYAVTNIAEGVLCFWCSSVWAATIVALFSAVVKTIRWRDVPVTALALSTGAILVEELT